MTIVVNRAFPAATTTPDGSVMIAQSLVDPHLNTMGTSGSTIIAGAFPATDSQGNPNSSIDFTLAGTDLSR